MYVSVAWGLPFIIYAWKNKSRGGLTIALILAIIFVYLKIWTIGLALVYIIVAVHLWWQDKSKWTFTLIINGIIAGISLTYFVLVLDPFTSVTKLGDFSDSFFDRMIDIDRLRNNWIHGLFPLAQTFELISLFSITVFAGIIAYSIAIRQKIKTIRWQYIALLSVFVVIMWFLSTGVSFVDTGDAGRMRHVFPTSIALFAIWSAFFIQIIWTIQEQFKQIPKFVSPMVLVTIATLSIVPSYISGNQALIERYDREHVINELTVWFNSSPPNDGRVLLPQPSDLDRVWNRIWGSYGGSKPFDWWNYQPVELDITPDEMLDRGMSYILIDDKELNGKYNTDVVHEFLDASYLVKTFDVDSETTAGFTTYVYRLASPQVELASPTEYGEQINLIAYDLSSDTVQAGDVVSFRPYWTISQQPSTNYSMFIHIYGADDTNIRTQMDGALINGTERLTLTWTDTDEIYFGTPMQFNLPADLPSGDYRIAIGVYDFTSFARLMLPNGDDFYTIPITVE